MPLRIPLMLSLSACLLLNGCATLFAGGKTELSVVMKEPRQATVQIENASNQTKIRQTGSDSTFHIDRRADYLLTIDSPNFEPKAFSIKRQLHPASYLNLALPVTSLAGLALTNGPGSMSSAVLWLAISTVAVPIGLAGLGIDAYTGNLWKHDTQHVTVELQQRKESTGSR